MEEPRFKAVMLAPVSRHLALGRDVPLLQDFRLFEGQECATEFFACFLATSTALPWQGSVHIC